MTREMLVISLRLLMVEQKKQTMGSSLTGIMNLEVRQGI